jgi:hypothetical protein
VSKCKQCGKELATPLDEYGPLQAPVCAGCWYQQGQKVQRHTSPARQVSLMGFGVEEVDDVSKGA